MLSRASSPVEHGSDGSVFFITKLADFGFAAGVSSENNAELHGLWPADEKVKDRVGTAFYVRAMRIEGTAAW